MALVVRKRKAIGTYRASPMKKIKTVSRARPGARYGWTPMKSGVRYPPIELNYVDYYNTNVSFSTTSQVLLLNGMTLGSGPSQHIGLKAYLRSIEFDFVAYNGGTATLNYGDAWLVYDQSPNGAAPTMSNIIDPNGDNFINLVNRDRFKILKHFCITLCGNSATPSSGEEIKQFRGYLKMNEEMVFNSGNAGTVADIQTGALYFVCKGAIVAGTGASIISINTRVRYIA